jgi:nucleoside phosphorylase
VCAVNEIPFLLIRTISDKADGNATTSYMELLPEVAKNSFEMVAHVLNNWNK